MKKKKTVNLERNFSQRFKIERNRLKYTQSELAQVCNISQISISQYEQNKTLPSLKILYKLKSAGMDIIFLVTGERYNKDKKPIDPLLFYKKAAQLIDEIEERLKSQEDFPPFSTLTKVKMGEKLVQYFEEQNHLYDTEKNLNIDSEYINRIISEILAN